MASQGKGDDYVFDRSYIDNARLNLQHKLWIDIFGYLLHPDIPISKPDLKVADIGTGTGIWLTDMSRKLPSTAQLDGFDISLEQAEPLAWFPYNVSFRQWDVMTDVPADLVGKYDVVHIRMFVFVVLAEEGPKPILEKLVKLLKPGGYLQWSEPDATSTKQRKTDPSNSSAAFDRLYEMFMAKGSDEKPTWVRELPVLFHEAGLDSVKEDVVTPSERDCYLINECNELAWGIWWGKDPNMQKMISEAVKESKKGVMFQTDRVNVIGKKVLDT